MASQSQNRGCFGKVKLPVFTAEHRAAWYGLYLWSVWASYRGCVPSQPVAQPQPACGGVQHRGKQKVLVLCKRCSAIAVTPQVCYQHCSSHRYKAQHQAGVCGES